MSWRNAILVGLVTLPLLVLLALGFGQDPHAVPSMMVGKPAPACHLKSLDGKPVLLADFVGKPVVVNFWASWCLPCEAEHMTLQQAARTFSDRAAFVGVIYQDEPANAERYLARRGSTYPQLVDSESHCAIDFGVAGVPETFFIDETGTVFEKAVGPVNPVGLAKTLGDMLQRGNP